MSLSKKLQAEEYKRPYHWEYRGFSDFIYKKRIRQYKKLIGDKGGRALDVGCGDGRITAGISDGFESVIGIDIDSGALKWARKLGKKSNVEYLSLDICKRAPNGKFDVVLLIDVIEHFTKEQADICMKNIRKCMRTGGILIVSTPLNRLGKKQEKHEHEYSYSEIQEFIRNKGFIIEAARGDFIMIRGLHRWYKTPLLGIPSWVLVKLGENLPHLSKNVILKSIRG